MITNSGWETVFDSFMVKLLKGVYQGKFKCELKRVACCGHQQPPSLLGISNKIKQRGTLRKNSKILAFNKFSCLNSLRAISHRRKRVKCFPMLISKPQRSDARSIASHLRNRRTPICDIAYHIVASSHRRISHHGTSGLATQRPCDLAICDSCDVTPLHRNLL